MHLLKLRLRTDLNLKFHLILHSPMIYVIIRIINVAIKVCTWQSLVLSYPHVIKSGWG